MNGLAGHVPVRAVRSLGGVAPGRHRLAPARRGLALLAKRRLVQEANFGDLYQDLYDKVVTDSSSLPKVEALVLVESVKNVDQALKTLSLIARNMENKKDAGTDAWHIRKKYLTRIMEKALGFKGAGSVYGEILGDLNKFQIPTYYPSNTIALLSKEGASMELLQAIYEAVKRQRGEADRSTTAALHELNLVRMFRSQRAQSVTMTPAGEVAASASASPSAAAAPASPPTSAATVPASYSLAAASASPPLAAASASPPSAAVSASTPPAAALASTPPAAALGSPSAAAAHPAAAAPLAPASTASASAPAAAPASAPAPVGEPSLDPRAVDHVESSGVLRKQPIRSKPKATAAAPAPASAPEREPSLDPGAVDHAESSGVLRKQAVRSKPKATAAAPAPAPAPEQEPSLDPGAVDHEESSGVLRKQPKPKAKAKAVAA